MRNYIFKFLPRIPQRRLSSADTFLSHVIIIKMAGSCETLQERPETDLVDGCEDLDKILSAVVKKRKTIPTQCMEIDKEIFMYDLLRLENAKVITEENENNETFRCTSKKILRGLKELKSSLLTLDDIKEAEQKLTKLYDKAQQLNSYLEKRKRLVNEV